MRNTARSQAQEPEEECEPALSYQNEGGETDLSFFTNEAAKNGRPGRGLLQRFQALLNTARHFDMLVGYFRTSGFAQLHQSFEELEKIRVLVGISLDGRAATQIQREQSQHRFDFQTHHKTQENFQANLLKEIEETEEPDQQLELGLRRFIEFLRSDCQDPERDRRPKMLGDRKVRGGNGRKMEFRAFPSQNLHAKVYIGRYLKGDRDRGFVITGSSNFSYSGLVGNREFNVELRDPQDIAFAERQFEELWADAVDISDHFVEAIEKKSWLNDHLSPYELYLKMIYEYFKEDLDLKEKLQLQTFLPEGFYRLQYQEQAVAQALKKLHTHGGVFLSDVVGLGKTFIAAQILQQVKGHALVICPPVLQDYWKESLATFKAYSRVESLGQLDKLCQEDLSKYDYVVVDEAHRFRNDKTQSFADLLDICRGKKVMLLTATPLNNRIDDIFSQLKLFQAPNRSTIPGLPNLNLFFNRLRKRLQQVDKGAPNYRKTRLDVSSEIRDKVLKHVMVRRTRADVETYFKDDLHKQGIVFPSVAQPDKIVYEFQGPSEACFLRTVQALRDFCYARYTPLLYYKGRLKLSQLEKQTQRNIGGFMRSLLVKRLESSLYAFRQTLGRMITSHERFIQIFEEGHLYIGNKVNVFDKLDAEAFDELNEAVNAGKIQKYSAADFGDDYHALLQQDLACLKEIAAMWSNIDTDPKYDQLLQELQHNPHLRGQRLIIFTESRDTGHYLFEKLQAHFSDKVLFFSSEGGRYKDDQLLSTKAARSLIQRNFDPNHIDPAQTLQLLITTDVLAEGMNLHRAGLLMNYDLPWNPTRVLQRVGRINRLGSKFETIRVFNFFPTTVTEAELGLEQNIMNKIQIFHDILGEDAKYLSDGEEIGSQELFQLLTQKDLLESSADSLDPELYYLTQLRELRDTQPKLFAKIKGLPKKSRSGLSCKESEAEALLTFFRLGPLKKFYLHVNDHSREITFYEAAQRFECAPDTARAPQPDDYHDALQRNRKAFERDLAADTEEARTAASTSHLKYIELRLQEKSFRRCPNFSAEDKAWIVDARAQIKSGSVAAKQAQRIRRQLEKTADPVEALAILQKYLKIAPPEPQPTTHTTQRREIVLSTYLRPC